MTDIKFILYKIKNLNSLDYEEEGDDNFTIERSDECSAVTEDMMVTVIDVLREIKKLPEYEKSIVIAYATENPAAAAQICAEMKPEITNRTVHYNRARKVFNKFVSDLRAKGISWP